MANLFSRLWRRATRRLSASVSTDLYECRRCGTALDGEAEQCPYCGPTTVARYEIQ